MPVLFAALLATATSPEAADGFHVGLAVGAGYSYDGAPGLRLELRYGQWAISGALGRDTLASTTSEFGNTVTAPFGHSAAATARWIAGGDSGLTISFSVWWQREHTATPFFPEPHADDHYLVLLPAIGWRFRRGPLFFELNAGLPFNRRSTFVLIDEPSGATAPVPKWSVGFSGCGYCDAMPLPAVDIGVGVSF
jgi:hypothetical protein